MLFRIASALAAVLASTIAVFAATVTDTRFTVTVEKRGQTRTYERPVVPLRVGACYYWHVRIKNGGNSQFTFTEEFILPAKPAELTSEGDLVVAEDGHSSRRTFTEPLSDGWGEKGWCVGEGDPLGTHNLNIYAGDRLLHSFQFEVVTPAEFAAAHSLD